MSERALSVQCCIAGGGPAGIVLGYLLARAGVEVAVLEKWPDFFRDFRGDTIHPSTMEVLHELGLLDKFLALPHNKTYTLSAQVGEEEVVLADFSRLRLRTPYVAFMPQWDFLNFIAGEGKQYPQFHLLMHTEATGLIEEGGAVVGVTATDPSGALEVRAPLTVGADGRHSTVREAVGFKGTNFGAPMDVLWFHLSRKESDPQKTFGSVEAGHLLIMIERGDYWQCGFVIPKGRFEEIKKEGIEHLRGYIARMEPFMSDRVGELGTWNDVKFLSVVVDRLDTWAKPGLLVVGDAAHAMSPIGGVGINLAVQDAVAAANILAPAFARGGPSLADLRSVRKRRMFAVRATQQLQLVLQNQLISRVLVARGKTHVPAVFRLLRIFPALRKIPARIIGVGFRPEHISPALKVLFTQ